MVKIEFDKNLDKQTKIQFLNAPIWGESFENIGSLAKHTRGAE